MKSFLHLSFAFRGVCITYHLTGCFRAGLFGREANRFRAHSYGVQSGLLLSFRDANALTA